MARPKKEGLEYFPLDLDIDQDDKLIVPVSKYGMQGFGIIIKIMMEIYRNGYFYPWGDKEQYVFASRVNVDIKEANEVINECINWRFFHPKMFEEYQVLTSKGFQKRYIEAAKRRKEITLITEYVLVDVEALRKKFNVNIHLVNANINNDLSNVNPSKSDLMYTESTQSKVKESKVKESNKKTLSRQQKKYAEDSSPYRMAKFLHNKIMAYAESISKGHLVRDADMQKWADECRKIIELDKRDREEAKRVIDFATTDDFWQTVILSPKNLRKKYTELCMRMDSKKPGRKNDLNEDELQKRLEEKDREAERNL